MTMTAEIKGQYDITLITLRTSMHNFVSMLNDLQLLPLINSCGIYLINHLTQHHDTSDLILAHFVISSRNFGCRMASQPAATSASRPAGLQPCLCGDSLLPKRAAVAPSFISFTGENLLTLLERPYSMGGGCRY